MNLKEAIAADQQSGPNTPMPPFSCGRAEWAAYVEACFREFDERQAAVRDFLKACSAADRAAFNLARVEAKNRAERIHQRERDEWLSDFGSFEEWKKMGPIFKHPQLEAMREQR